MDNQVDLREWLDLDDTAKRLSLTFEEEITDKDVLSFFIEGKIQLSWRHPPILVEEVCSATKLLGCWFSDVPINHKNEELFDSKWDMNVNSFELLQPLKSKNYNNKEKSHISGLITSSDIYTLRGITRLVSSSFALTEWIIALTNGTEEITKNMIMEQSKMGASTGTLLASDDRTLYRLRKSIPPDALKVLYPEEEELGTILV